LGLKAGDVVVRISSRRLISTLLDELGCTDKPPVYLALDRREKLPREDFEAGLRAAGLMDDGIRRLDALFGATSLGQVDGIVASPEARAALAELETLFSLLGAHGVSEWVRFDPTVVRGLAYYTGVVYEVFDAGRSLRAIAGGGRYDDLLQKLGGERLPAVGFGMGDVVIAELLKEKGLLPSGIPGPDLWLVSVDGDGRKLASLAARLRSAGREVGFSFGGGKIGKQMQAAQENGAKRAVLVGSDRVAPHEVEVKDLSTGEQVTVSVEDL